MYNIETNKETIAYLASTREDENDAFRSFIRNRDGKKIDEMVFKLNTEIEKMIDCTSCGACCNGLMINVTKNEAQNAAQHLEMTDEDFKKKYIEESISGNYIINTIPCHFLKEKKCDIYQNRFNECKEFPHLHKPNFNDRLFGTLIHYSICPIIYNVVEQLKIETKFKDQ